MTGRREEIMRAFNQRLLTIPEFNTVTRRLRSSADFNRSDLPVIMIDELYEDVAQGLDSTPDKTTINVELWVFNNNAQDPEGEPISALNALLDTIDVALAPDLPPPFKPVCTLGGLVQHCWINGRIDKNAGDIGGIGIAKVPVQILIP